ISTRKEADRTTATRARLRPPSMLRQLGTAGGPFPGSHCPAAVHTNRHGLGWGTPFLTAPAAFRRRTMLAKKRVLVVEDDASLTRVLRDNLLFEGFEVECASNADAAIARAREFSPDLTILDVMLPGGSGFEIADHLCL